MLLKIVNIFTRLSHVGMFRHNGTARGASDETLRRFLYSTFRLISYFTDITSQSSYKNNQFMILMKEPLRENHNKFITTTCEEQTEFLYAKSGHNHGYQLIRMSKLFVNKQCDDSLNRGCHRKASNSTEYYRRSGSVSYRVRTQRRQPNSQVLTQRTTRSDSSES
jgi:hypothetical protein